ncbi:hypothetical protein L2E82_41379 [Cichorium intybus]|uniref:Uncharacterized protein n=1 Tax=Cichorium intybus TaxID=13427 RepID=A0ACB9ANZ4_CICIN|nr:hypothetical protein L2E82_41379 [Cichorium intybus]
MHQKFVDVVHQLGDDRAFPKKIVELMNVPGLTRENVASHLQKHRMSVKRDQERLPGSSYDITDPLAFYNNSQPNFQESHWDPFRIRPINTTIRTFPNMPLLNTIQIKPDRSFRVCGDEKKNILLSIQENKVSSNTRFVGFRLASDGKSVEFGQNSRFHDGDRIGNASKNYIVGDDDSTLGSERDDWMSSIAGFLGVDESLPTTLTHRKPPPTVMTQPPPAAWSDWAEPPVFTPPQPSPGNEVNENFKIFNEFTLGTGIDENGVDATGISVFDDLLFDNQDLT